MMPSPLVSAALLTPHGFFTRQGGVSVGPFASLNCSLSGADDRDAVLENRACAVRAIGAAPESLLGLTQVHGAEVVTIAAGDPAWLTGDGPRADAMVTDRADVTLGIITADCTPILFFDVASGIAGAAHAGWRGAVAGVLEATVAAMEALGARRSGIAATLGPCIRQASYEVAADLRDAVLARDAADSRFFLVGERAGRWQFDLAGYCATRLETFGVGEIDTIAADTLTEEKRFFSHRRRTLAGGGPIGHQISLISASGR